MLYCKSLGYEKFTSNPTFLQDFTTGFLLGSQYGKNLPIKLKLIGMQSKFFTKFFPILVRAIAMCLAQKKSDKVKIKIWQILGRTP